MAWWHRRRYSDFSEEISSHIALETERLIEDGVHPDEARAAAIRRFGNPAAAREAFYESRSVQLVEAIRRDFRQAFRSLVKHPGFALTAVFTLGLGAGVSASVMGVAETLLSRPLPVRNPGELVLFRTVDPAQTGGEDRVPGELFQRLAAESETLAGLVAHRSSSTTYSRWWMLTSEGVDDLPGW